MRLGLTDLENRRKVGLIQIYILINGLVREGVYRVKNRK